VLRTVFHGILLTKVLLLHQQPLQGSISTKRSFGWSGRENRVEQSLGYAEVSSNHCMTGNFVLRPRVRFTGDQLINCNSCVFSAVFGKKVSLSKCQNRKDEMTFTIGIFRGRWKRKGRLAVF
jgi:hypothetical protein